MFYAKATHARRERDHCVPVSLLRERLDYAPDTGELRWRPRPEKNWTAKYAGKEVGWTTDLGYRAFHLTFNGHTYEVLCHRAAWAITTGAWPLVEIDHRDGIRSNNRWVNLREATHPENAQNRGLSARNTSGLLGVHWDKKRQAWRACIRVNGRLTSLGHHPTRFVAHEAYLKAKAELHPFQPVPRP
jgi:hypothetical protein